MGHSDIAPRVLRHTNNLRNMTAKYCKVKLYIFFEIFSKFKMSIAVIGVPATKVAY